MQQLSNPNDLSIVRRKAISDSNGLMTVGKRK